MNGHCFVSVMLCVPVWNKNRVHYLSVPLGYRMWQKKESKLELAASMVRQVMPEFKTMKNVILLCDSWYVKKNPVSIVDEYENPDLIGNAGSDSVIYGLHCMGKSSPSRMISISPMKKPVIITQMRAASLQIFLVKGQ